MSPQAIASPLTNYINSVMSEFTIKTLEDNTYFAEIPSCPGVWANEKDQQKCVETLREVLEEWLVLELRECKG